MTLVKKAAATALALPLLVTGISMAAPAGQIEGGDIYRVRIASSNASGGFTDPLTANCNDTVQFRVRIHNTGPDALTGVRVQATLDSSTGTSHSSTVTVSAANANPTSVTDTAGVNLSSAGSLSYVSGTTELLDPNGATISTLGDGIVTTGVDVPNGVGVSIEQQREVQFQAKVNCPTTPPVTPPSTPKPPVTPAPTKLVNTGPGDVAAVAGGATFLGSFLYRRRLARSLSE
jgi:uncharacterized repeat protein (TIGR01451 family)